LKRLGLEKEITTMSSVSKIKKKLPTDLKREWSKLVTCESSTIDKMDKFPSLLRFLLDQKQAIKYENSDLRTTGNDFKTRGSAYYSEKDDDRVATPSTSSYPEYDRVATLSTRRIKCLIHEGAYHWIGECKVYLSKTVEERRAVLKEKGACWSCLRHGHRIQDCRNKRVCGVNDCTKTHHMTLHKERQEADASANTCNNKAVDTQCLLQVQKIRTKKGWINMLWDNGSSLCFIMNKRAKAEKLKGTKTELSLVKVGGVREQLVSYKYKIPLIDKKGQELQIDVYSIDKITSDIPAVNLNGVYELFKNVPKKEIERPTGEVDVLIGYEYAGFHPQKEQSSGHLLLLKNQFGRCIGGTHQQIKITKDRYELNNVQVLHISSPSVEDFYNREPRH